MKTLLFWSQFVPGFNAFLVMKSANDFPVLFCQESFKQHTILLVLVTKVLSLDLLDSNRPALLFSEYNQI